MHIIIIIAIMIINNNDNSNDNDFRGRTSTLALRVPDSSSVLKNQIRTQKSLDLSTKT